MSHTKLSPLAWHLVARAPSPQNPFTERAHCVAVWNRMHIAFPEAIAATLMPNHLHLVVGNTGTPPTVLVKKLRQCLCPTPWQPLPTPEPIADRTKLRRQLRYVHLNPCRKRLSHDPIYWEWSTHLDYLGLTARPWPQAAALKAMGLSGIEEMHKYVSADPTTQTTGTPLPRPRNVPDYLNMDGLMGAAALHYRIDVDALQKKGPHRARFAALLTGPFRIPVREAARRLGMHPSSVAKRNRIITAEELREAEALITILHDPRLRALAERASPPGEPDKVSGSEDENTILRGRTRHFVGFGLTR